MRAMTMLLCAMALVSVTSACGGQGAAWESAGADLTGSMPPLQSFSRWDGRTPFVPSYRTAPNLVMSVALSPDDRTHFRGYGTDGTTGVVYYQVDGVIATELGAFSGELAKEAMSQAIAANGVGQRYTWGGTGDLHIPLPTGPGPSGEPWSLVTRLQSLATAVYKATLSAEQ